MSFQNSLVGEYLESIFRFLLSPAKGGQAGMTGGNPKQANKDGLLSRLLCPSLKFSSRNDDIYSYRNIDMN